MTDEKLDQILRLALAPEIDEAEIRIFKRRKDKMRKSVKVGTTAAAVIAAAAIGIGTLGYFNPVLAAKIPLVGRIFEKIGGDVTYSGDYTNKESVLTKEDSAGNLDTPEYSVSDSGITITASEVYCDGYSIFLTVNLEAEEADFTHIPQHYTGIQSADSQMAAGFYIDGTWSINAGSSEQLTNTFEGEVIDSHTFAGMLKLDLPEKSEGSGHLSLNVNGLGYDDDRISDSEEISASHWSDGRWNMVLPFEVNRTDVKTIEIGETEGNITLNDIVVSPYQVIVHATTPGEQRELTDDRREKFLSKDPNMTEEEMLKLLGWTYEPCQTLVFNQDGELLYPDTEMPGRAGFAVQGKEIRTLHVFIFDNLDDWAEMENEGMNSSAADKAVIVREIKVE